MTIRPSFFINSPEFWGQIFNEYDTADKNDLAEMTVGKISIIWTCSGLTIENSERMAEKVKHRQSYSQIASIMSYCVRKHWP